MGPTWGPPGPCRPQMGPMLAPWILLSRDLMIHPDKWLLRMHGGDSCVVRVDEARTGPTPTSLSSSDIDVYCELPCLLWTTADRDANICCESKCNAAYVSLQAVMEWNWIGTCWQQRFGSVSIFRLMRSAAKLPVLWHWDRESSLARGGVVIMTTSVVASGRNSGIMSISVDSGHNKLRQHDTKPVS